jgi:hypothetical protein
MLKHLCWSLDKVEWAKLWSQFKFSGKKDYLTVTVFESAVPCKSELEKLFIINSSFS